VALDSQIQTASEQHARMPSFGTASLRMIAPQLVFDMVRAQVAAANGPRGNRWPASAAANENDPGPHSDAA
jgi:hypothetical protein